MDRDLGRSLLRHGFALIMVTMLLGGLIPMPFGDRAALTRAHVAGFLIAFLVVLAGLTFPQLRLSQKWLRLGYWAGLFAGWDGVLQPFFGGLVRASSFVHGPGKAPVVLDRINLVLLIAAAPFALVAVGVVLAGLRRGAGAKAG